MTNEFSIQLHQLLKARRKSVVEMAQYCCCDRTTIYKFLHGTRVPNNLNIVQKMAAFLCLSESEANRLYQAYRLTALGSDTFYRQEQVLHLFQFFHSRKAELTAAMQRSDYSASSRHFPVLPDADCPAESSSCGKNVCPFSVIEGKKNVLLLINELVNYTEGTIRVLLQGEMHDLLFLAPDTDGRFSLPSTICSENASAAVKNNERRIEHLILLSEDGTGTHDVAADSSSDSFNMSLIASSLYCSLKCPWYQSYYLYHQEPAEAIAAAAFPFYLLTEGACLQISSDLSSGLLIANSKMLLPFQKQFAELKESAKPLFCRQLTPADYLDSLPDSEIEKGNQYFIYQPGPYMGSVMTPELIQKVVSPSFLHDERLLAAYASRIASFTERSGNGNCKHVLTPEGIRHFLETGYMPEFPCDVYLPPNPKLRREMLRDYLHLMMRKDQLLLLRKPLSDPESGLCMSMSNHYVYFSYNSDFASPAFFLLTEPSLVKSFLTFFQTLDSDMVYSQDETEQIVQLFLDEATNSGLNSE